MTYKEKMNKVKMMLNDIDFVDDSKIIIPAYCENEEDLDLIYDCLINKEYTNPNQIGNYAFYLYMKRNHPSRIIEDDEQK